VYRNKIPDYSQQDAKFIDSFLFTDALHVSGGSSAHHQEQITVEEMERSYFKLLRTFVISIETEFLIPEKLEVLNIFSSHSLYQLPNALNKMKYKL
jgi:hypothetical protein